MLAWRSPAAGVIARGAEASEQLSELRPPKLFALWQLAGR